VLAALVLNCSELNSVLISAKLGISLRKFLSKFQILNVVFITYKGKITILNINLQIVNITL
jgi:hypothetical protein